MLNTNDIQKAVLGIQNVAAQHGAHLTETEARQIFTITLIKIGNKVGVPVPSAISNTLSEKGKKLCKI